VSKAVTTNAGALGASRPPLPALARARAARRRGSDTQGGNARRASPARAHLQRLERGGVPPLECGLHRVRVLGLRVKLACAPRQPPRPAAERSSAATRCTVPALRTRSAGVSERPVAMPAGECAAAWRRAHRQADSHGTARMRARGSQHAGRHMSGGVESAQIPAGKSMTPYP